MKLRKINGFLYQTTFSCQSDDIRKLLELEKFYREKKIQSKIYNSEFSPAMNLWKKWVENSFFSMSSNSISFLSGFRNGHSQSQRFLDTNDNIKFRINQLYYNFISLIKTIIKLPNNDDLMIENDNLKNRFHRFYPNKFIQNFKNPLFKKIFKSNSVATLAHLECFVHSKFDRLVIGKF